MPLNHCILHKLERSAPGGDINSQLSSEEANSSGPIFSLFEQLKHSFQRSAQKQFGHFDSSLEENPLPQWIKQQQQESISFISLSQNLVSDLSDKLDSSEDAFSAHILVALETVMEQKMLYVFWLEHSEALYIDSNLEVSTSSFINSKKMHYAIKCQLSEWLEEDNQKYLTMITSRGNKVITEAFTNSIGFAVGVDVKSETKEFLTIVNEFAEKLPEQQAKEYKEKVIDYCVERDSVGEPVVIKDLSSQLNESAPLEFSSFVSDKQETPLAAIHTDRSSLKRFIRFFGRDKDMSISFSSGRFGSDITFDEMSGRLTLNQIPKSLRQQLNKHLKPQASSNEQPADE
ncbi:nucleoid-associated protein [Dasania sp. GY-MA-18]|uniref:Nucleoid-associated protein n=1 Tax=Dasania phycosphaerae TaxID=2950436 RepID=A0A9J6RNR7_9GAMM|nr:MULTISPECIES: nucleoid-associated protein [Dasania]MCR8923940.1 nucleoid-associated protein [Dasania sp. GY-MA-18]MCZ0866374.1 nucleoid-associated protein [Dasania phycosphaerae]MCZ0870098.1 nucleoid-associated protein [Dasania phycosphaerae]